MLHPVEIVAIVSLFVAKPHLVVVEGSEYFRLAAALYIGIVVRTRFEEDGEVVRVVVVVRGPSIVSGLILRLVELNRLVVNELAAMSRLALPESTRDSIFDGDVLLLDLPA